MMDVEVNIEKATQGKVVGVIIPPPEIRAIVDKTAQFVGKNGKSFEQRILNSAEGKTAKFNFMREFDPYHAYYELKIRETEEAISKGIDLATLNKPAASAEAAPAAPAAPAPAPKKVVASSAKATPLHPLAVLTQSQSALPSPPPPEFILTPPLGISARQWEVVKLTAQYTAVLGRDFLTALVMREGGGKGGIGNPLFDFLKPTHLLFGVFTSLVDQYARILNPDADLELRVKKGSEWMGTLERCMGRWENKKKEAEKKKDGGDGTADAVGAGGGVDWQDFVVVEVIDFGEDELLDLPIGNMNLNTGLVPPPPPPPASHSISTNNTSLVPPPPPPPTFATTNPATTTSYPAPDEEDEDSGLKVVTDYTPRLGGGSAGSMTVIDPVTGQPLAIDKLSEHMRISLLDPKWREEQKRFASKQEGTGIATGGSILESLKTFAKKRGDIFGMGVREAEEVRKEEEESKKREEEAKEAMWDGSKGSIAEVQKRREAHPVSAPAPAPAASVIGPSSLAPAAPSLFTPTPSYAPPNLTIPTPMSSSYAPAPPAPNPIPIPASYQNYMPQPPGAAPFAPPPNPFPMGYPSYPPAPVPFAPPLPPGPAPPVPVMSASATGEDEREAKKPRVDLIPEQDFASRYPSPITVVVTLPSDPAFQPTPSSSLTLTVPILTSVKDLKDMILQQTGSSLSLAKLQVKYMSVGYLKDTMSLAGANVGEGGVLEVSVKSRGGKR